ncbi:YqzE family protein [Brevibacillus dissolubilis]|uniref:YqzE family protein n=1 Tax=Brevibacillus dissolubilis TaxID=1844116 RepID=UPI001116C7A3|nr:YqzE family protein [Brevibacillus dissolubilis]
MSFQDYLKYMVKHYVNHFETPKEERRSKKLQRESWTSRWFGVIPMSIKLYLKK